MKTNCNNVLPLQKGNLRKLAGSLIALFFFCVILLGSAAGPAKDGFAVTGAPFDNSNTCSMCHSDGAFGGSMKTELLNGGNKVVTSYIPGGSYTFRITFNQSSGSPQYGFQTTVATSSSSADINSFGTLPPHIHVKTVAGHTYIEQSQSLSNNVIEIPWIAPAVNTGSVIFYTAGNLVNGDFYPTGDEPLNNSLTVSEAGALPITLLYFKGSILKGAALLSWATSQELNNKNFILEKSLDGSNYAPLATINAKGNSAIGSTYSYVDNSFKSKAFYRLKQVDISGNITLFNVVVLRNISPNDYNLAAFSHDGNLGVLFYNPATQQKINVRCANMQGKILYSYNTVANEGNNFLPVSLRASTEILIITITTENGIRKSVKVGITK